MLIGVDGNEANVSQRVGSNQYAFELLQALYKLENSHQWVIYFRERPLVDMPKSRLGWFYRVFGPQRFWTQWRLPLDLYLHQPRPNVFFSPGHYVPRWSPVPLVVSIMDLGYLKFPQQFRKKDLYQLTSWTERSLKKASHILAISQSTKNDIIKTYPVPEEKITVSYPGYDSDKFKIPALPAGRQNSKFKINEIKKKYGIEGEYILFLGTLKPSKNVEGLIEAYKLLTGFVPVSLVIAGKKGWLFQSIFEKVKQLKLGEQVIFTDFVPEDEVPGLMAGARVFVLPSFWEGFGIPVVEAMACGVPVVVSNAGSLPEVVGKAGIVVDPYHSEEIAQGIQEAIVKGEELKQAGLERVKDFSWEACARKTLKVLEGIDDNF